jgi:S1-C subfamily serine protease
MLLGLRILGLDDDSVMRAAGFRAGDRITALDDSELHDPADLPELLARSAKELDVCAQRAGEAFCRTVSLE